MGRKACKSRQGNLRANTSPGAQGCLLAVGHTTGLRPGRSRANSVCKHAIRGSVAHPLTGSSDAGKEVSVQEPQSHSQWVPAPTKVRQNMRTQ